MRCYDCKKEGKDVKSRQCDYFLCDACNQIRYDNMPANMPTGKITAEKKVKSSSASSSSSTKILTIAEAAVAVHETQSQIVDRLNLDSLDIYANATNITPAVRQGMASILPKDTDRTEIANHAIEICNKLRDRAQRRKDELSTLPTLSQSILLSTSTPLNPPSSPKLTAARVDCSEICKFGHLERGKTSQLECSLCQGQYHKACIGVKPSSKPPGWICPPCKNIPNIVRTLSVNFSEQEKALANLRRENSELKELVRTQTNDYKNLQNLVELKMKNVQPSTPLDTVPIEPTHATRREKPDCKLGTARTLLIGDSMIRDFEERGLGDTKIECIRGTNVSQVNQKLKNMTVEDYGTVMLHVATNDCTSQRCQNEAVDIYTEMVSDLQTRAPNTAIVISSVCPRVDDNGRHQPAVDCMNSHLRRIASDKGCMFVDNDSTFKHQDKVDESLLNTRGLHLNRKGTRRLLQNLHEVHPIIKKRSRDSTADPVGPSPTTANTRSMNNNTGSYRQQRPARNSSERRRDSHFPARCDLCGLSNHRTRDCRHRQPVQCHTCHEFGHKSYIPGLRPYLCRERSDYSFWQ